MGHTLEPTKNVTDRVLFPACELYVVACCWNIFLSVVPESGFKGREKYPCPQYLFLAQHSWNNWYDFTQVSYIYH